MYLLIKMYQKVNVDFAIFDPKLSYSKILLLFFYNHKLYVAVSSFTKPSGST